MITYVMADLFQSPAKVLVNTVNTVGVMGKGIAFDFKRIYPDMFKQYQLFCEREQFEIGQLWLYKTSHKWILNFPTKRHWREKSRPEYVEAGLRKFRETYDSRGITSIAFPMLGCGNGELDWETEVRPLMEKYLADLPIDIYIHIYDKTITLSPEHRNIKEIERWLRGEPQSLAFTEFWRDLTRIGPGNARIKTYDNTESFIVTYDEPSESIIIGEHNIAAASLVDLWQSIRASGFYLPSQEIPIDVPPKILVSLLAQLPYMRPVMLSRSSDLREQEVGLQLILPTYDPNGTLFASAPKQLVINVQ